MNETATTEELWKRFASDLAGYFRRRLPAGAEVDDLLQETFARIHAGLPGLRSHERLPVWLYRVARSALEDHRRAARRTVPLEDPTAIPDEREGEPDTLNREVAAWARTFLEHLPAAYREAVRLADLDGLPQTEVGRRLGLSLSGAKSRVQRGRALLREALLACCHLALDRHGNVLESRPREPCRCPANTRGAGALLAIDPMR